MTKKFSANSYAEKIAFLSYPHLVLFWRDVSRQEFKTFVEKNISLISLIFSKP
jgi:hypothetical protein